MYQLLKVLVSPGPFNGGQSMFVDFLAPSMFKAFTWQDNSLETPRPRYRCLVTISQNNLVATSAPLDLVDGQWQFLSGGELTIIGVHRLELRSNAPTTWFAIDNLEISEVPEPSSVLLFAAIGVAAGVRRRR